MLVITRRSGQSIRINDDILIKVFHLSENQVRIGIEAPFHVKIHRQEVYEQIKAEQRAISKGVE